MKYILNKIIAVLSVITIAATAFSCSFMTVFADYTSKELIKTDTIQDIMVMITYEKEKPLVRFISPSNKTYSEDTSSEKELERASGDNWVTYKIVNAEAGSWKIEYDKKSNDGIYVSVVDSTDNIWIQSFKVNEIKDTNAKVTFNATLADKKVSYKYEISIITDNSESNAGTLVSSGYAETGENKVVEINLSNISSYDKYRFELNVEVQKEDVTLFDYVQSDVFSYTNPKTPEAISNVDISVIKSDLQINLDWSNYDRNSSVYYVLAYADDATEPFYNSELTEGIRTDKIYYENTYNKIKIQLYKKDGGVLSKPLEKEITLNGEENIEISTPELTNSFQAVVNYNFNSEKDIKLTVNEVVDELKKNGNGNFSVSMTEGNNDIEVSYLDENGINFISKKTIYLDLKAPIIELYENIDGKTFNDKEVSIVGQTEAEAVLTSNGTEVKLLDGGTFNIPVSLKSGENIIELIATDKAGNKTIRTLTLNYANNALFVSGSINWKEYLPLIISFGLGMIMAIFIIVFLRPKKTKNNDKTPRQKARISISKLISICSFIIAGISLVLDILFAVRYFKYKNIVFSDSFISEYENSIDNAINQMNSYERFKTLFIVFLILTITFAIIGILTIVISKLLNRPKQPPINNNNNNIYNSQNNYPQQQYPQNNYGYQANNNYPQQQYPQNNYGYQADNNYPQQQYPQQDNNYPPYPPQN